MDNKTSGSRLVAEIGFAIFIMLGCAALLPIAFDLPAMSALLPVAILVLMIGLGLALAITQYLRRDKLPDRIGIDHPHAAFGTFAAIFGYALAVQFIGFYTSTIVMIPLVGWIAGYRSAKGLALATVLFVGLIYLIFTFLMSQRFPAEFFADWGL